MTHHLQTLITTAARHMAPDRAEELARNIVVGLTHIDEINGEQLARWAYVYTSLIRRELHFGLVLDVCAGTVAAELVSAWDARAREAAA